MNAKAPILALATLLLVGWTPRPPARVAKEGNHLARSSSVYLRQHAHNPLEWYPWGPKALNRAVAEDKPIFLSIGYASCHWCHVMEHEVFEDEDVAAFMNANFINIKVDREERPDLDEVYMNAVTAMTGRGGWPMTVFLTPSLKPFFGGTYFPKPRFLALARQALGQFRKQRNEVELRGNQVYAKIVSRMPTPDGGAPIDDAVLQKAATQTAQRADPTWGGFGRGTKFPTPTRWMFLLHAYRKWGDPQVEKALRTTLSNMASGGIQDHVAGGFHRYTVEQTWLIPHFEKMLYDNAQLAKLYIEAAIVFADPEYERAAKDTLDFMRAKMFDPRGGFYASYDADSGGHEGSYYVWTPAELEAVAGSKDGAVLADLFGVTAKGNFEGKNVLTRRSAPHDVAKRHRRDRVDVEGLIAKWRPALEKHRDKRVAPGLDKKIVTAWNGLAISAFSKGYSWTKDPNYSKAAKTTADFLWSRHRKKDGSLVRASTPGHTQRAGRAVLDDYAFFALGLLDLFEATGDVVQLRRALTLIDDAKKRFANVDGSWSFTDVATEAPLGRPVKLYDSVRPSGVSQILAVQLRLSALTGEEIYHEDLQRTLAAYAGPVARSGTGAAGILDVAMMAGGPYYELVIAGESSGALTDAWRQVAPPWVVKVVPNRKIEALLPTVAHKTARKGKATAYVCVRGSCKRPTSDPALLEKQLRQGWRF